MSRTFRRKKDEWLRRRYVDFWFTDDGEICPRFQYWANKQHHGCTAKQIRQKLTSYWMSDAPNFWCNPPSYVRTCRRQHRAALNQELIKEVKRHADFEDVYPKVPSKNYIVHGW